MTVAPRRRALAVLLGALALAAVPAAASFPTWAGASTAIEITIRYSRYEPAAITVPRGRPATITLVNEDPIDHEWIVGTESVHRVHRTGTETAHESRPTEVTIPALETRTTTVTFDRPGRLSFICHLPGHEAYGMVGTVDVR